MAASDNLNQKLFHGTSKVLNSGDVIHPTEGSGHIGKVAYATTEINQAAHVAKTKATSLKSGEQGMLFAPIYEVEGVGDLEPDVPFYPKTTKRSKNGYKVKKIARYVKVSSTEPDNDKLELL